MNKQKQSTRHRAPLHRQGQRGNRSSWSIPLVVGLTVVAILTGAILSFENRPANKFSVPVVTVQPQPTNQPPFPHVPRISLQEAKEKADSGQAVLIDVRSKQAYDSQHIAGALSFPEEEIEARLSELPRDRELILYCT